MVVFVIIYMPPGTLGFLKLLLSTNSVSMRVCVFVCVHAQAWACVCVSTPKAINKHWRIWIQYDRLNKFYSFFIIMAAVIGIVSRFGLKIEKHRSQSNKTKQALHCITHYFQFKIFSNAFTITVMLKITFLQKIYQCTWFLIE